MFLRQCSFLRNLVIDLMHQAKLTTVTKSTYIIIYTIGTTRYKLRYYQGTDTPVWLEYNSNNLIMTYYKFDERTCPQSDRCLDGV